MALVMTEERHPPAALVDVRCRNCGRLLLRIATEQARVEVVCPDNRCKRYQQHRIVEVSRTG